MIDRVVAGVAVAGVVVAIALGTRQELGRSHDEPGSEARAPVGARASRAQAETRTGPPSGNAAARASSADPGATTPAPARLPDPTAANPSSPASPASALKAAPEEPTASQGDAASLLRRASAAYGRVRSMSASFVQVMRNPLLGTTTTSRGTLYQRRPDRFAMRFSQPAGDLVVSDGRYFWVYYPSVDAKQVMRMPASAGGGGGVDLQSQFVGDAAHRFNATLLGREAVAGRQAYVLRLVPRTDAGYQELKVWLDPTDYLARRFEISEQNGSVRRFDLGGLRVNPALGDAVFRFTPPPGSQVISR